jgi:hypothetical protein
MKIFSVFSICLLILSSSCEKDKNYEVIYPGPYFPVYPNSWWKYIDQDSVITIDSTGPSYFLDNYFDCDRQKYSDLCYVPYLNGSPIYYYDKIEYQNFPSGESRWPILSEEAGATFKRDWYDPRNGLPNDWVVVKEKYFNGTDSVLVQESRIAPGFEHLKTYEEFAKNIGLIRKYKIDTITSDTFSRKILIDYYVSFDSTYEKYSDD